MTKAREETSRAHADNNSITTTDDVSVAPGLSQPPTPTLPGRAPPAG
jgi:hypothetical protein